MNQDPIGQRGTERSLALQLAAFAVSLLMVAVSTLIGILMAPLSGQSAVVLLYLPSVLAAALHFGLWPSLAAAIASTLAFNFFFTAPYHTLRIQSPADLVTVVMLFLVAVVTSRLAAAVRDHAKLVGAHAARNATIAGFARRLLSSTDEQAIAGVTVQELSRLFGCNAVIFKGRAEPTLVAWAPGTPALAAGDFAASAMAMIEAAPTGRGTRKAQHADWQFHPVAGGEAVLAAVGLARDDGAVPIGQEQSLLLKNLLDQAALALERARLDREAREVAALRARDGVRSAMLSSIGIDVKPRLHAAAFAIRTLKRGSIDDKALLAEVGSQVAMLERYIDNLVDLGPGEEQAPIVIGPLSIDLHRRMVLKDGNEVRLSPKEYAVLAELAKHAGRVLGHSHLLRAVWGPAQADNIDYLRVAIGALRKKLENDPSRPELILNEPTVGYRLALL